jgi:hypothetical protein
MGGIRVSIRAEGKFTTMDVFWGSWPHVRKSILFILICSLFTLSIAVFLSFNDEEGWRGQWIVFAIGLLLPTYFILAILYRAKRQVKRSPNLQGTVQYNFDDDGFVMQTLHSKSEIKWTGITKWKEGKHSFIIYSNVNLGNIVPKRFFQSPSDVDAVRVFLQTKVPRK